MAVVKKKERIKQYMLRLIATSDKSFISKTMENFSVSKSTIYNYLKELCSEGLVERNCQSKPPYLLKTETMLYQYDNDGSLDEDRVFDSDIIRHFETLDKNVLLVWRYAFTEMMNNAIEHSNAKRILVMVKKNAMNSSITLSDDGIGIFKNIQLYMMSEKDKEMSLDECATLLLAGKFTTAEQAHSGEGIFFTSHLMDRFLIYSDDVVFSRDNFHDIQSRIEMDDSSTLVYMELHNKSRKTTQEVFNRFSDIDEGFIRTQIPLAHVFPNGCPVSRSEARRLGELIVRFKEINLDFSNVDEVGQAFVHELFIVWQNRNPDAQLNIINANSVVTGMIKRVKNTK